MNLESELQKRETIGLLCSVMGFPGGSVVKDLPAGIGDARDMGLISGLGKPPGVGNDNPLQYSCLENSMDRGTWWAAVHWVAKSQTQLTDWAPG